MKPFIWSWAWQWLNGVPPYAGAFDVKPPLLFLFMAGAEALFGTSLLACKALASAATALTACGLYLYGERFLGAFAGAAAAILYIFSTLAGGGTFFSAELLMAPFTTFGVLMGLGAVSGQGRARIAGLLASGVLFGAAACVKQTAVFEAAPLALWLILQAQGRARLEALGMFAAGFSRRARGIRCLLSGNRPSGRHAKRGVRCGHPAGWR